jgi:DNA-directed RNA polymerase specialized sigma24 family protein
MKAKRLTDAEVNVVVARVARRYAKRCWWAEVDDLSQTGWEAATSARASFDPSVGVPEAAYLWRAIVNSMRRYLWRESSPVSGGHSDPWRLRTQTRAPLPDGERDETGERRVAPLVCKLPRPDALLAKKRWVLRVLERVSEVSESVPGNELAIAVLLDEWRSREVAEEMSVAVHDVYTATARVRRGLANDDDVRELAEELDDDDN